jgi:membrane protease YdiL (CAAX protease family)
MSPFEKRGISRKEIMKGFLKFAVIFAGILLLAAFLAPILYDWLPKFLQIFGVDKIYKFERIHNRIVMIASLIAVAIFVRVKKETLKQYGILWRPQSPGLLAAGLLTGVLTLGAVSALRVFSGHAVWAPEALPWTGFAAKIAVALATGLLVGAMEEFFFRGFIFRSLMKVFRDGVFLSVLVTTAFYAVIHFIGMKKIFIGSDPGFVDGLRLIGAPFLSLAAWPKFWPQAVGLFLFGLALITAVYRSGSLYPAIGLHAGCVFFVRLDDLFIKAGGKTLLWGSKIIYDGVVGWVFLILLAVFAWVLFKPKGAVSPGASPEIQTA